MDRNFQQWLRDNELDAQTWTPELQRSLRQRFEAEHPSATITPASEVLIMPVQCQWPARCYRVEAQL